MSVVAISGSGDYGLRALRNQDQLQSTIFDLLRTEDEPGIRVPALFHVTPYLSAIRNKSSIVDCVGPGSVQS